MSRKFSTPVHQEKLKWPKKDLNGLDKSSLEEQVHMSFAANVSSVEGKRSPESPVPVRHEKLGQAGNALKSQKNCRTMRHPIHPEWLPEHCSFRHLRWPPKSPDMDIIEYIWDALQRDV
ncbi:hypothetical protein TNCT_24871 [Trichonephila clavata]|uniref:Uncharacterized protein n=1 Tax=Trichonephila clavata TaxID=2740835 RepID=A0A8X6GE18_TRICU|nr:hypothetical protein TNCT_24871 [Trichonephila clavata]